MVKKNNLLLLKIWHYTKISIISSIAILEVLQQIFVYVKGYCNSTQSYCLKNLAITMLKSMIMNLNRNHINNILKNIVKCMNGLDINHCFFFIYLEAINSSRNISTPKFPEEWKEWLKLKALINFLISVDFMLSPMSISPLCDYPSETVEHLLFFCRKLTDI